MLTTHPSIMLGSYVWDQDWLPGDEFRQRLDGLEKVMDQRGWAGMLVYGDAREHAALAWTSNFIPRMRWGMALLARKGEPKLLASMSSRDIPAMRTMTWIPDVATGWEWKHFDSWVERLSPGGVLGTAGFAHITPLLHGQVERTLAGKCELVEGDDAVRELRRVQRPREVALIRRSAAIADATGKALVHAWTAGTPAETALLEAERSARGMSTQDVRTLLSIDGGQTLRPFRGTFDERPGTLVAYIGVKYLGYWSEVFVSLARQPRQIDGLVARALAGLVDAAQQGITADALHARASDLLGGRALHPALGGSIGSRIGLAIEDGAKLTPGSSEALTRGNVYALRVGTIDAPDGGAIASALVHLPADGSKAVLCRSPLAS